MKQQMNFFMLILAICLFFSTDAAAGSMQVAAGWKSYCRLEDRRNGSGHRIQQERRVQCGFLDRYFAGGSRVCHTVGLKADGTVVATGYNSSGQCNVGTWTDIIQVSAGYDHTVGLKADGTVVATGDNVSGQCNVSTWTGISQVTAGSIILPGLS